MCRNFTSDKPKECKYCYFWKNNRIGCELGGEEHCYYIAPDDSEIKGRCGGCPYGRDRPCIGFCLVKIMNKDRTDSVSDDKLSVMKQGRR